MAADTWAFYSANTGFVYSLALGLGYDTLVPIINGSGSGVVVRVYRVELINDQYGAIVGAYTNWLVQRGTGLTIAGTPADLSAWAVAMDSTNAALPSQLDSTILGGGLTGAETFRTLRYALEEFIAAGQRALDFETMVPFSTVWDAGVDDANVQPITVREGEIFTLTCATPPNIGVSQNAIVVFTVAGS